jgi:hypothetical protein
MTKLIASASKKKKLMVLKFCMDLDTSTADGKLIKVIKKYEGKTAHAEDRTQTSSSLTAKFKFLSQVSHKQGHPHSLMQILIDAAQYLF